jgi:ABC-type transport system involved in multi-copper enzyme maturation permease subunit
MSAAEPIVAETPALARAAESPGRRQRLWDAVERGLIALTERANPILVKETRQALKSRQFVVTFLIVLVACWIVSFAGVAIVGPQIYYAAVGAEMLVAYYSILAFPLALIVPYTAFRSLAAEQEDNTYDLLTITTLTSRQIVTGKLLSAVLQMMVYVSAVSPCIAFTFLLRGVDALTTVFLLGVVVLGSLGLSVFGLLVGAVARARHTQVVISVALVLGLAWAFIGAIAVAMLVLEEGSAFLRDPMFWVAAVGALTLYATTMGLLHAAAAAQIAFVSENRSTPLRRWMMVQQACFCGALAAAMYAVGLEARAVAEMVTIGVFLAAGYWYVMGCLMTAEWPHLSRRVQRSLPQSQLGRTFLSLFNPGPGAGYLFAVANLTMLAVAGLIALVISLNWTTSTPFSHLAIASVILCWGYVVAFLGLGRLVINLLRRWVYVPMAGGFLVHVILLLSGIGIPTIIQMTSRTLRYGGYSMVQVTNPFWTLMEVVERGGRNVEVEVLVLLIPAAAAAMLLLNIRSVAAELMHHRIAPPIRVAEDEAALWPAPVQKPANPWETADEAPTT